MICPHCGKDDTFLIMSVYHCRVCAKSFTPLESKQGIIIRRLQETIRELKKEKVA